MKYPKHKRCQKKVTFCNGYCELKKENAILASQMGLKGTGRKVVYAPCGGLLCIQNMCRMQAGVSAGVPVSQLFDPWGCGV